MISTLLGLICISSQVFVGCRYDDHDSADGVGGIYSAKVPQHGSRLNFSKITSTADSPIGIGHHDRIEQLFYAVQNHGIFKCDFNGSNNEEVLTYSGGM